jgi:hypothetical protein
MKSRMLIVVLLVCVGVFIQASVARAASGLSETLKEKLVCTKGSTCTVVRTGTFKVSGEAFEGEDLDPGEFDESSIVVFEIGDLSYNGTLGDDPKYVAGAKSATFVVSHVDSVTGKTVIDVKITLKPGSSGVKISASGKISDSQSPILADNYAGTTNSSISTNISAFVQMGAHTDSLSGTIGGTASIKTMIKNGETNNLSSVKLKSVKAP